MWRVREELQMLEPGKDVAYRLRQERRVSDD
jgi:hypothetical protein